MGFWTIFFLCLVCSVLVAIYCIHKHRHSLPIQWIIRRTRIRQVFQPVVDAEAGVGAGAVGGGGGFAAAAVHYAAPIGGGGGGAANDPAVQFLNDDFQHQDQERGNQDDDEEEVHMTEEQYQALQQRLAAAQAERLALDLEREARSKQRIQQELLDLDRILAADPILEVRFKTGEKAASEQRMHNLVKDFHSTKLSKEAQAKKQQMDDASVIQELTEPPSSSIATGGGVIGGRDGTSTGLSGTNLTGSPLTWSIDPSGNIISRSVTAQDHINSGTTGGGAGGGESSLSPSSFVPAGTPYIRPSSAAAILQSTDKPRNEEAKNGNNGVKDGKEDKSNKEHDDHQHHPKAE